MPVTQQVVIYHYRPSPQNPIFWQGIVRWPPHVRRVATTGNIGVPFSHPPTTQHVRNVGPVWADVRLVGGSPTKAGPDPKLRKTDAPSAATGNIEWCRIWCRASRGVPDMGPDGSHRTGIDLRKSARPIPKTGRRKWRPALELCDVTPSSITT